MAALLWIAGAAFAQRSQPPNEETIAEGRQLYNRSCTTCHGHDGAAGDRAPALAAPRRYTRNTDTELFDAIKKGIDGTQMPPSGLADEEVRKVVAFVRSLRATASETPVEGNLARGEQIFWGKGGCGQCHMIRGKGGILGSDLSNVAGQRSLRSIRDALTTPRPHPAPGYQPVRVVTTDGRTLSGVVKNEHNFSLQLLGTDNQIHLLTRDQVREIVYEKKSLMPGDYDRRLAPGELQDLLAFLSRQGTRRMRQSQRGDEDLAR